MFIANKHELTSVKPRVSHTRDIAFDITQKGSRDDWQVVQIPAIAGVGLLGLSFQRWETTARNEKVSEVGTVASNLLTCRI